jgi:hypothetical protein
MNLLRTLKPHLPETLRVAHSAYPDGDIVNHDGAMPNMNPRLMSRVIPKPVTNEFRDSDGACHHKGQVEFLDFAKSVLS